MNPVGDVSDRDLVGRPFGEKRLEEVPADLSVQAAHAVDRPAPAHRQVCHVEGLRRVVRVLPAQCQKIVDSNAELLPGVPSEILLDESRGETVEPCRDRSMRGKEVSRPRDGQRDFEGLSGLLHETAGPFQYDKGRVPFIEMTDFGPDAKRTEESPAAQPEEQLLLQAQLRPAPVELACDAPVSGVVCRVITVQQIKLRSADLDLPGAQPDGVAGELDFHPQPLAVRLAQRGDRQLSGVVVREKGLLRSVFVDHLAEVALLVEQSHPDHRHPQIACGFELVAGHVAKPPRINGESLAQHKLHAEICSAGE